MAAGALAIPAAVMAGEGGKEQYSLLARTPDAALREMSTDRPDKTESAYTVDAGRWQIETDLVAYTRDRESRVTTEVLDVVPFNLKFGLTHDMDVQFVYGSLSRVRIIGSEADETGSESGGGDLTIRVKRNLWGNDGGRTALALMPFVKLPVNSLASLNSEVEGGLIVPLAIDLGHGAGLGLMTEVDVVRGDRGYEPVFINSATVSFDLNDKLGVYTEIYTERGSGRDAATVVTFDAGVTYAVTGNLQLDAGVNLGVTKAADDMQLFAGLSQRF
jgi:hypothetical protein